MPPIKLTRVISFSSEDPNHTTENLRKGSGKWLSSVCDTSRTIYVEFQLEKPSIISFIDIGNHLSSTVLLEVSLSCSAEEYVPLMNTIIMMNPVQCRAQKHESQSKVKMFTKDDFNADVANRKWDRLKVTCSQKFINDTQFGLSFIKLRSDNAEGELAMDNNALKEISLNENAVGGLQLFKQTYKNVLKENSPISKPKKSLFSGSNLRNGMIENLQQPQKKIEDKKKFFSENFKKSAKLDLSPSPERTSDSFDSEWELTPPSKMNRKSRRNNLSPGTPDKVLRESSPLSVQNESYQTFGSFFRENSSSNAKSSRRSVSPDNFRESLRSTETLPRCKRSLINSSSNKNFQQNQENQNCKKYTFKKLPHLVVGKESNNDKNAFQNTKKFIGLENTSSAKKEFLDYFSNSNKSPRDWNYVKKKSSFNGEHSNDFSPLSKNLKNFDINDSKNKKETPESKDKCFDIYDKISPSTSGNPHFSSSKSKIKPKTKPPLNVTKIKYQSGSPQPSTSKNHTDFMSEFNSKNSKNISKCAGKKNLNKLSKNKFISNKRPFEENSSDDEFQILDYTPNKKTGNIRSKSNKENENSIIKNGEKVKNSPIDFSENCEDEKQLDFVTCPICNDVFESDIIERHASGCDGFRPIKNLSYRTRPFIDKNKSRIDETELVIGEKNESTSPIDQNKSRIDKTELVIGEKNESRSPIDQNKSRIDKTELVIGEKNEQRSLIDRINARRNKSSVVGKSNNESESLIEQNDSSSDESAGFIIRTDPDENDLAEAIDQSKTVKNSKTDRRRRDSNNLVDIVDEKIACPICEKFFSKGSIEVHADICAFSLSFS